ncbi:sigma-54-dependent Fis family transcriptional regulator [Prolixibacteraceae bacterium JC049]|nr:sigma-54-dependent Fis family transcriptional regulator [Prolixibacteraceae bacterium JC049]
MKVLVVDDDNLSRSAVADFVAEQLGFETHQAVNAYDAIDLFRKNNYEVVISDIRMPGKTGIELLSELKEINRAVDVVIMTGFGDMETSIAALRNGATDYLLKPVNVEQLAVIIDRIAEYYRVKEEIAQLKNTVEEKDQKLSSAKAKVEELNKAIKEISGIGKIGVFSRGMKSVVDLATRFHDGPELPVLIEGETGTGKEVIARLIHTGDKNDDAGPFVPVNCAAISPHLFESELFGYAEGAFTGARKQGAVGKMELAQNGTLFLDEIGEMPLEMQPKLLRVLQERELYRVGGTDKIDLNVRVVCATNRDLKQMVDEGTFRSDLYYRLSLGIIKIPGLKDRKEDIVSLAQMFLNDFALKRQKKFRFIDDGAKEILENYSWPGNVRELQNTIERVVLLNNEVTLLPEHLLFLQDEAPLQRKGYELRPGTFLLPDDSLDIQELEYDIVSKAMKKFDGNKTKVAEYLGITRSALRSRLSKL